MHAGEEDHARPGWTTSRCGQDSPWKSQSKEAATVRRGGLILIHRFPLSLLLYHNHRFLPVSVRGYHLINPPYRQASLASLYFLSPSFSFRRLDILLLLLHSYCLVHATHCLSYCTAQYTLLPDPSLTRPAMRPSNEMNLLKSNGR